MVSDTTRRRFLSAAGSTGVAATLAGCSSESAGESEVAVDLSESLVVSGPDGETVLDEEFHYDDEFSGNQGSGRSSWCTTSPSRSTRPAAGTRSS